VAVNLIVNLALVRTFGFKGLAAGTSLAAMVNAGFLLWLLRRRLSGIEGTRIARAFVKILAASLLMGAAAHLTMTWVTDWLPGSSTAASGTRVAAAVAVGLLGLVAAARVLRIEEFEQAFGLLFRRGRLAGPAA